MQTPHPKHGKLSNHQISQIRIGNQKNIEVSKTTPDFLQQEFF